MVMWLVEKSVKAKFAQFIEQNSSRLTDRQTEEKKIHGLPRSNGRSMQKNRRNKMAAGDVI